MSEVAGVVSVRLPSGNEVPMERAEAVRRVLLEEVTPAGWVPNLDEKRAQAKAAFAAIEEERISLQQSDWVYLTPLKLRICFNLLEILERQDEAKEAA